MDLRQCSVLTGVRVLNAWHWSTQCMYRPDLAMIEPVWMLSDDFWPVQRSKEWFEKVKPGIAPEPDLWFWDIPMLKPAWVMADILAENGGWSIHLAPDDIEWDVVMPQDEVEWKAACQAFDLPYQPLSELVE